MAFSFLRMALMGGVLLLADVGAAMAHDHAHAPHSTAASVVHVHQPYGFATVAGARAGAVFMQIESDVDDRLVAVETAAAGRPELHTHLHENGVMKMRKVDGFAVPAQTGLTLKPGGDHIMLLELTQPLAVGEEIPLILVFETAGRVGVTATIRAAGDVPPAEHGHGHDGGHNKGHDHGTH